MTQTDARPLAVVTGASSGIGLELAKQFAQNGFDLLVVAEDEAINGAATELESYGVAVQGSQIDLATYDGVEHLYTLVSAAGRPVDAIALNAGVGAGGGFVGGTELQDELQVIDLNVKSIVHLAKRVLPDMVRRGEGRVLFTSSIAFDDARPVPRRVQRVEVIRPVVRRGDSLRAQGHRRHRDRAHARRDRHRVLRAGRHGGHTRPAPEPRTIPPQVARQGFEALMAGDEKVVAGSFKNRVQAKLGAVTPDSAKAAAAAKLQEPGGARLERPGAQRPAA